MIQEYTVVYKFSKLLILIVMAASVTQINTVTRKVLSIISEHNPGTATIHLMTFSTGGFLTGSMQQCTYWCPSLENNETGNVHIMEQRGTFVQPLLQRKSNKCYISSVCVCTLRYTACKAHVPYYGLSGLYRILSY